MIGAPTTLTTSGQRPHHFVPLSSINNDAETICPVIATLHMRQKIICECRGSIGHKSCACIIRSPKLLPPSLIKKYQFNFLYGEEPNEPHRECTSQSPTSHFKYRTSPPKTSPVVSAIMRRLNHRDIDNVDGEVYPSEFPVEFNSESVPDPYTTLIKPIDDD